MDAGGWSAGAVITHPELHVQVHKAYIEAGAEMITANTYSANYYALMAAGREAQLESINRQAVALAIEARAQAHKQQVAVAGSISTDLFGLKKCRFRAGKTAI